MIQNSIQIHCPLLSNKNLSSQHRFSPNGLNVEYLWEEESHTSDYADGVASRERNSYVKYLTATCYI